MRSSATAEDLPTASFAGQQDTYLNVVGAAAVLEHVRRCWASLFTERAVAYRVRNGIDHRTVRHGRGRAADGRPREAAGVMFTADPVTSNRKVVSVEATLGLGEALVPDWSTPTSTRCASGRRRSPRRSIAAEAAGADRRAGRASWPAAGPADRGALRRPQDIEWCLADDGFQIVQSRPITTLFPIPAVDDGENHVYVSVGHQQMMTDAMKPLGLSLWQLTAAAADARGRRAAVRRGHRAAGVAGDPGRAARRASAEPIR